jgi:tetratricopeptide (TPR) repeat protein
MTFTPTASTPDELFYACRNHPYMGAAIHIVDPGQSVAIKQRGQAGAQTEAGNSAPVSAVTQSRVKQKLMFAEMMSGSQSVKRVLASQNDEAKQLVQKAKQMLVQGREKTAAGALPEALDLANSSLKMLSEATRLVPSEAEMAHMAEDYKSKLAEINDYEKSYSNNVKHLEKTGGVPADAVYDEKEFAVMLSDAAGLAKKGDYAKANKLLDKAQRIITVALHKMLDSKTLVYDLKFDSPADEFEYELKRFGGYEELIPVAIEAKKPTAGAIKLMESFLEKARKRRDEAKAKAEAGDYSAAIGMMQQATKTVRRALRMVGVTQ